MHAIDPGFRVRRVQEQTVPNLALDFIIGGP